MKFNSKRENRVGGYRGGFTLVELLLVLAILTLLAAIVYPKMTEHSKTSRIAATKVQIKAIEQAVEIFEVDNGRLPQGHDGLLELVQHPLNLPNWHGPYVDQIPKDVWGNAYVYVAPGKHRTGSFDLSSAGPDGQLGTTDDLNNWPAPEAAK